MLTWTAVPLDCHGAPEQIAGFVVFLWAIRIVGWTNCEGGECPIYERGPWMEIAAVQETSWAAPDPPLGGVDWWRVEQVDAAGNRSDEECP